MDESTQTKECRRCRVVKPLTDFSPHKRAADRHAYYCRPCMNIRIAESRERRRLAEGRPSRAETALANAAITEKNCSACGLVLPLEAFSVSTDRSRGGRKAVCKACIRAYHAARYEAQREEILRRNKKWRLSNPAKFREGGKRWLAKNPNFQREANLRRRARRAGRRVEAADLDLLWTGLCGLCGEQIDRALPWPDPMSPSVDHVIPLALGGDHVISNLQWTHLTCNVQKGARRT